MDTGSDTGTATGMEIGLGIGVGMKWVSFIFFLFGLVIHK